MPQAAVFLDRDGTIVEDVGYLWRPADVRWFPFAPDAIRLLNRAGYLVYVTTNQSGVARGYYTEDDVRALHRYMTTHLSAAGARVDGWYHCPHHPNADVPAYRSVCTCRKPEPGLIEQACGDRSIDLARSVGIGDKLLDVEAAARSGARGVLVRTGYGDEVVAKHGGVVPMAAHVAADLMAAVAWLLASDRPATRTA